MSIEPQVYLLTPDNVAKLGYLGFTNVHTGKTVPLHEFINRTFPHFNLVVFLERVLAALGNAGKHPFAKAIEYNSDNQTLTISISDANEELRFIRQFCNKNGLITVHHTWFELPLLFRGKTLSQYVLKESMQQYINMGLNKIEMVAALDNGGYVWAKYGFVATKRTEVTKILELAENQLTNVQFERVKAIYNRYYSNHPDGTSFPMILWANIPFMKSVLTGAAWHGELDLKNEEQFNNFTIYVSR